MTETEKAKRVDAARAQMKANEALLRDAVNEFISSAVYEKQKAVECFTDAYRGAVIAYGMSLEIKVDEPDAPKKTIAAWEFVEQWYPNYYSSDAIAELDRMQRIINVGDIESVDDEDEVLMGIVAQVRGELARDANGGWGCDLEDVRDEEVFAKIKRQIAEETVEIYEAAIRNYFEEHRGE